MLDIQHSTRFETQCHYTSRTTTQTLWSPSSPNSEASRGRTHCGQRSRRSLTASRKPCRCASGWRRSGGNIPCGRPGGEGRQSLFRRAFRRPLMIFVGASAVVSLAAQEEDALDLADALEGDPARLTSPIALWETAAGLCRTSFRPIRPKFGDSRSRRQARRQCAKAVVRRWRGERVNSTLKDTLVPQALTLYFRLSRRCAVG